MIAWSFPAARRIAKCRRANGRRYRVTIRAQDKAGNRGSKTSAVTVPHDRGDRISQLNVQFSQPEGLNRCWRKIAVTLNDQDQCIMKKRPPAEGREVEARMRRRLRCAVLVANRFLR